MAKDEESSAEENFSEDEQTDFNYSETTNKNTILQIIVIGVVLSCLTLVIAMPYFLEYITQSLYPMTDLNTMKYLKSEVSIRNASYTSKRWHVQHRITRMLALKDGSLAIAYRDHTINITKIIDLNLNMTIRTLKGHKKPVFNLAVLDEGHIVSSSSDGTIKLWKLSAIYFTATFYTEILLYDMIILSNGLLAGISNHQILIWDPATPWYKRILKSGLIKSFEMPENVIAYKLIELKNGNLVTGSNLNTTNSSGPEIKTGLIHIWDINTGEILINVTHERSITSLVLLDDKLVSSSQDGSIIIWNVTSYQMILELPKQISTVTDLAVLKDNSLISCSNGKISIWNLSQTRPFSKEITVGYDIAQMTVLQNGNLAIFPIINDTFFEIFDTNTNMLQV